MEQRRIRGKVQGTCKTHLVFCAPIDPYISCSAFGNLLNQIQTQSQSNVLPSSLLLSSTASFLFPFSPVRQDFAFLQDYLLFVVNAATRSTFNKENGPA